MSRPTAVISDFGGVLTSPLMQAFAAYQDASGVPLEALGRAMQTVHERDGRHPLFELEVGRLREPEFLAKLGGALEDELGRPVEMHAFTETYWAALHPNDDLIAYYGALRSDGHRLALLTNNVREWEPRWRRMLPVDDLFEVVVDSAFVGMRKPDREIYELTLERFGATAAECVFVDDLAPNCETAETLGMTAVLFQSTEQAIADVNAALGRG